MKSFTKNVLLGAGILLAAGCSKEIKYNIDLAPEQLVINGLFSPQSGINVQLYRSAKVGINNLDEVRVSGADCRLYREGVLTGILTEITTGRYLLDTSQTTFPIDKPYTLICRAAGLPEAQSQALWIPEPIEVSAPVVKRGIRSIINPNIEGFKISNILTDPAPSKKNFYTTYLADQSITIVSGMVLQELHEKFACDYTNFPNTTFSDICLSSNPINLNFVTEFSDQIEKASPLIFIIAHTDSTFYRYNQFVATYPRHTIDFLVTDPEPTPSNIINGYGIIGLINSRSWVIEL